MSKGKKSEKRFCGFQSAHVVVSEYNKNGQCKCLSCPIGACSRCQHYRDLVDESVRLDQVRLERCINCVKQR